MQFGYPLPKRLSTFQNLDPKRDKISTTDLKIAGSYKSFDVFEVSIELPKYRLDNTRTLDLQEKYLYDHNLPETFFEDVESDEVQLVQHELLKKVMNESGLYDYFKQNRQTAPLILTHDGFVISGNRRLCSYRELLESDFEKYKHFSLVRVAILPNYPEEQIEQIEDFLEQEKDIKEPFTWVSRAIGYRKRMLKHNYTDKKLAEITGLKKADINNLLNKLELAESYLENVSRPKDYDLVKEDDFAFTKILECHAKEKNPAKKKAFEKIAFLSLKNKNKFSGRMYSNIPTIYEAYDLIQTELRQEFAPQLNELENKTVSVDLLGNKTMPDPSFAIAKLAEKPELEQNLVDIVVEQVERYEEIKREKKRISAVLNKVQKAHSLLVEANMIVNKETKKDGVLNQINSIETELEKLKDWLDSK